MEVHECAFQSQGEYFFQCSIGSIFWEQSATVCGATNLLKRKSSARREKNGRTHKHTMTRTQSKRHSSVAVPEQNANSLLTRIAFYIDTHSLLTRVPACLDGLTVQLGLYKINEISKVVSFVAQANVFIGELPARAVNEAASGQSPVAWLRDLELPLNTIDNQCYADMKISAGFTFVRLSRSVIQGDESNSIRQGVRTHHSVELMLKKLFYLIDTDGSGSISLGELLQALQNRLPHKRRGATLAFDNADLDWLMGQLAGADTSRSSARGRQQGENGLALPAIEQLFAKIVRKQYLLLLHNLGPTMYRLG